MNPQDLRAKKKFLKQVAEEVSQLEFNEFKEKVDDTARYIILKYNV